MMKKLILTILALFIVFEASKGSRLGVKLKIEKETIMITRKVSQDVEKIINDSTITDGMLLQYMTVGEFKEVLAFHESRGDYKIINKWGFKGRYQFSDYMIRRFANTSSRKFLNTPTIQERAMLLTCAFYVKYIYDYGYDKYIGKEIDGVTVTLESLMLGLHFSPTYLKEWVESGGKINRRDANISIGSYMKRFENKGDPKIIYKYIWIPVNQ